MGVAQFSQRRMHGTVTAPAPSPPPPAPRVPATVLCSATNHTATKCERDTAYISAGFLAVVVLVGFYLLVRRCRQDRRRRDRKRFGLGGLGGGRGNVYEDRQQNVRRPGGATRGGARSASSSFSQGRFYGERRLGEEHGSGYGSAAVAERGGRVGGRGEGEERGRTESGAWSFGTDLTPGRHSSFDSDTGSITGQSVSSSVLYGGSV